jgi:hypothetical protein
VAAWAAADEIAASAAAEVETNAVGGNGEGTAGSSRGRSSFEVMRRS